MEDWYKVILFTVVERGFPKLLPLHEFITYYHNSNMIFHIISQKKIQLHRKDRLRLRQVGIGGAAAVS